MSSNPAAELNKKRTKGILDNITSASLEEVDKEEAEFWKDLIKRKLKPVSQKFTHIKDVQKSLESLRNSVMGVLLLVNVMWILLLVSLQFSQLDYQPKRRSIIKYFSSILIH